MSLYYIVFKSYNMKEDLECYVTLNDEEFTQLLKFQTKNSEYICYDCTPDDPCGYCSLPLLTITLIQKCDGFVQVDVNRKIVLRLIEYIRGHDET